MKKSPSNAKEKKMTGWLYGWKDIAAYIGCNEKTLRGWEKQFEFPIIRPANGRPLAHPKRIDEWVESFKKNMKT